MRKLPLEFLNKSSGPFCILLCMYSFATSLSCQVLNASPEKAATGIITERPFSAVKYRRVVHALPSGSAQTIEEESHSIVARDTNGRIFLMQNESGTKTPCDFPSLGARPACEVWIEIIFDPQAGAVWHWLNGRAADTTPYVQFDLNSDQIAAGISILTPPPVQIIQNVSPDVTMENLGERVIEGLLVGGVRTSTVHKSEAGRFYRTIHEVWTSVSMGLVLKVIDGDPEGEEIISGLDHISTSPAPLLFKLPTERKLYRHQYDFFDGDRDYLANWLVR